MPKMTLTTDNKVKASWDFPQLKLEKGERARLVALEEQPSWEYVHTLTAPQIVNGAAVYDTQTNRQGEPTQVLRRDFIGRHICIGDYNVIAEKGIDAEGCPVCAASQTSDMVRPPERRFAMHVIRYKTQPGSFTPQEPFQVELVVWSFADKVLNQLIDFVEEWGSLQQHDLLLGPCENKQYQKFDIKVAKDAAWLASDATKKLTVSIYKNNQLPDISIAIGRRISRDQVQQDLDKVLEKSAIAFGKGAPAVDLSELDKSVDADDILNFEVVENTGLNAPTEEVEQAFAAKKPAAKASSEPVLDLDDILNL